MATEGRLSPEELDDLLDPERREPGPALLDPSYATAETGRPAEGLAQGGDDLTWTARTIAAVRRHPRRTAAVVALVLVVGLGWQGYERTRPPPLDTRLATAAWFVPAPTDQQGMDIDGTHAVSRLHLQLPEGVTSVSVVTLLAPGLGPSTVTQVGPDVTVWNPLDCNAIDDLSGPLGKPVVKLTRTDAWGRTVSATLPVNDSPGTAAIPASVVAGTLRQFCVGKIADGLTVLSAASRPGVPGGPATLLLRIANPTRYPLLVLGGQAVFAPPDASIGSENSAPDPTSPPASATLVPAHATVQAALPVRRADCGAAMPWADGTMGTEGRRPGNFTLWVAPPAPVPNDSYDNWTSLTLNGAQRAAVTAALEAPCVGAPRIAYSATASNDPSSHNVNLHIRLRSSAGVPGLPTSDFGSFFLSQSWSTHVRSSGRALIADVTALSVSCGTDFAQLPPPTVAATVQTPQGTYPYQLTLSSAQIFRTLTTMCHRSPDLTTARGNGWAV